jgi:hypothetical protein
MDRVENVVGDLVYADAGRLGRRLNHLQGDVPGVSMTFRMFSAIATYAHSEYPPNSIISTTDV